MISPFPSASPYLNPLSNPFYSWTTLSLLVRLNDPPSSPNGLLELYVNDQLAISQAGLIIRTTPTLGITRMMFSTFFGGSEDSWAAKGDERAYFRNLKVSSVIFFSSLLWHTY